MRWRLEATLDTELTHCISDFSSDNIVDSFPGNKLSLDRVLARTLVEFNLLMTPFVDANAEDVNAIWVMVKAMTNHKTPRFWLS